MNPGFRPPLSAFFILMHQLDGHYTIKQIRFQVNLNHGYLAARAQVTRIARIFWATEVTVLGTPYGEKAEK